MGLGLGYMTPMTVFDTFGIVTGETNGVVPAAYLVALVAMVFTAISYGRMTRVYPSAGSAYTYASETIHPNVGFLVGWSSLLDYLLLPLVNALIVRLYLESFFPQVPGWIWVVGYVVVITAMNLFSMSSTSRVNGILVVFQIVLIAVFVVLTWTALNNGAGNGTPFSLAPAPPLRRAPRRGDRRGDGRLLLVHRVRRDHDVHGGGEGCAHGAPRDRARPDDRRGDLLRGSVVRAVAVPRPGGLPLHRRHAARDRTEDRRTALPDPVHLRRRGRGGRLQPRLARERLPHDLRHGAQRQRPHLARSLVHPPALPHARDRGAAGRARSRCWRRRSPSSSSPR